MNYTENEMRRYRCCFTGHRPEKLGVTEEKTKMLLSSAVDDAIEGGISTFITGMARGFDLWPAEMVLQKKERYKQIHLICATPFPGFERSWQEKWRLLYTKVAREADPRVAISDRYYRGCFQKRNEWMVRHSMLVIAAYNGQPGGTRNTMDFAERCEVEVRNILGGSNG